MKHKGDRRVVVTGMGLVTPLGIGLEKNWEALMAGRSGIGVITRFDVSKFAVRIGGEVRDFNALDWIDKKDVKKMDLFIQYAIAVAEQAMRQSALKIGSDNAERVGVVMGNGIGGLLTLEENHLLYLKAGLERISPFCIPKLLSNLAPAHIAIRYGARGINLTTTSACSMVFIHEWEKVNAGVAAVLKTVSCSPRYDCRGSLCRRSPASRSSQESSACQRSRTWRFLLFRFRAVSDLASGT